MKQLFNIKSILPAIAAVCLLFTISCADEIFKYDVVATHSDGIQNLDEEGIDCGGSSGITCPTCSDGIKNGDETGIDCGGSKCGTCPPTIISPTPRANTLKATSLPYYYTFESREMQSGKGLLPRLTNADGSPYIQGVDAFYGEKDPLPSSDFVTKIIRQGDGRFGGFEDFKFQPFATPIDFLVYHKWTAKVLIPKGQNFSGQLNPQVDLILHDDNANFWERWTVISQTIDESDFGKWVTLTFDGTNATDVGFNVLLPLNTSYTNISLVFGGSGHNERGVFYVKDLLPVASTYIPSSTPRTDALKKSGLPYYYTFETGDTSAGLKLEPKHTNGYTQGVTMTYGAADPAGSADHVGKVLRPANGPFGGYEDFKFEPWTTKIDFSIYHKFKIEVYIPSSNDFSGALRPQIDLIFHDNNSNFWERWTVISRTVNASDFDKWITIEYDGTNTGAADTGVLLPAQTSYDNFTIQFGGSGHPIEGTFYIKSFKPY